MDIKNIGAERNAVKPVDFAAEYSAFKPRMNGGNGHIPAEKFIISGGYFISQRRIFFIFPCGIFAVKRSFAGIFFGNAVMSKCSEVWVFGDRISDGMEAEIKRAKWKNYPLRYFNEDLEEVMK